MSKENNRLKGRTSTSFFSSIKQKNIEELLPGENPSNHTNRVVIVPSSKKVKKIVRQDRELSIEKVENKEDKKKFFNIPNIQKSTFSFLHKKLFSTHKNIIYIVLCSLLLILCFFSFLGTFFYHQVKSNSYSEESFIDYRVCPTKGSCFISNQSYSWNNLNKIPLVFRYTANYSQAISYQYHAFIETKIKVLENNKVLFKEKREVVSNKKVEGNGININFSLKTEIIYSDYQKKIEAYLNQYPKSDMIVVEVSLILDNKQEKRSISKVEIPIHNQSFLIQQEVLSPKIKVLIQKNHWSFLNFFFLGMAILLLVLFFVSFMKYIQKKKDVVI